MHACWNDAVEILPRLAILPRHRRGLARPFELCHARGASPRERAIGPNVTELKMTREGVCKAFGLSPELLEALESSAVLRPGEDGAFELSDVAAALFSYGIQRAKAADEKLAAVASALNDALPALQRLSTLPDHAALEGEPRERVTAELVDRSDRGRGRGRYRPYRGSGGTRAHAGGSGTLHRRVFLVKGEAFGRCQLS